MNFIEQGNEVIGFRPEAFLPAEIVSESGSRRFRFSVERVEDLGSHRLVYGTVDCVKVIANLSFRSTIAEGGEYDFSVRPQDLKRFDRSTSERVRQ
jgi:ABC-type sugar transport system ATPase subunit